MAQKKTQTSRSYARNVMRTAAKPYVNRDVKAYHVEPKKVMKGPFQQARQYEANKRAAKFNQKQDIRAAKMNVRNTNDLRQPELAKLKELTSTIKYGIGQAGTQLTGLGAQGIATNAITQNVNGGSKDIQEDNPNQFNLKPKGRDEED